MKVSCLAMTPPNSSPLASLELLGSYPVVLGAAMERARAVLAEDRLLRLAPHEVNQLEEVLGSEPEVVPQLRALIRRISETNKAASK